MEWNYVAGIIFALSSSISCAQEQTPKDSADKIEMKGRACEENYREAGNFFTTREFGTWQDFPQVEFSTAFRRLYSKAAKDGLTITNSDKEIGVITAVIGSPVAGQSPMGFNIVVEDIKPGGVKVSIRFRAQPNYYDVGLKRILCTFIEVVEGK